MPCLRGIELSLVIQPESLSLPEFPHPDASSFRVVSLDEHSQTEENEVSTHGPDSARIQKLAPRASVYIPSTPGSRFWVQYHIHRSPEPSSYLLFKVFMNGRHITSCGIKHGVVSGTISRALYEPSDRWHLKQNGTLLKRSGIESRSFCFSPGPDAVDVADDGGVIEVQVFRAKSRRRCTAQPVPHRDQQQYGITSPSTGLLEHPEDAVYYEWVLHDAVEAPFATFCFHYRAWAYLWDLNLVTDGSNSPLHNHGLGEGLGKNRRSDIAHDRSKGEVESSREESDLGNYDEDTKNTQVIEPETTRTRPYSQREALPNKELKSSKPINRQPSHRRKPSLHSTASLREIPRSGDPFITFLLPPVMEEEDPFTSPYIPLGHEMPTTSPTRSYYRHNARSRVHRPLPTVNEVPKLE
ncbi:hypothetical protein M441DRAFT_73824 [Trichoderma asperellum CBS 433.97]|uniref:Uncharacterized protein n=1 Tax=Trichoderma asperellum (strain ATCC 204424 / CBS 433.97 / NBRC 101777) TaxID=1042311 RepID=A0A2T3YU05_TRIA4|nr:hypothetical protein M441DRAFT_73824 [Trichoderma asperellum CBS 433.97]PTB36060.1 hypothetical protein M441DRAFT_73824 [Trichoderma asperellum CBS 433.97]